MWWSYRTRFDGVFPTGVCSGGIGGTAACVNGLLAAHVATAGTYTLSVSLTGADEVHVARPVAAGALIAHMGMFSLPDCTASSHVARDLQVELETRSLELIQNDLGTLAVVYPVLEAADVTETVVAEQSSRVILTDVLLISACLEVRASSICWCLS